LCFLSDYLDSNSSFGSDESTPVLAAWLGWTGCYQHYRDTLNGTYLRNNVAATGVQNGRYFRGKSGKKMNSFVEKSG
jgi:hypothetical protein